MKNFPKFVNNRADLDHLALTFPAHTQALLFDILAFKDIWFCAGKLADGENGQTDATHKVEEIKDEAGEIKERYQYVLMEDPSENGPVKRYGFADGAQMQAYADGIVQGL